MTWPRSGRESIVGVLVTSFFSVVLLAVCARITLLQISPPTKLREFISDRASRRNIEPLRGDLLDRRGRVVSTTRFAYRVIVDPVQFPDPPDEAIVRLAEASTLDAATIGPRILAALAENDNRRREIELHKTWAPEPQRQPSLYETIKQKLGIRTTQSASGSTPTWWVEQAYLPPSMIRYLPLDPMLDRAGADRILSLGLPGVTIETRPVRVYPGSDLAASLIGKVGFEHVGLLGAERSLDARLSGDAGHIRYVRDAFGRPLWVGRGDWVGPTRGEDVRLAIDLEIQRIAMQELIRGVADADAAGGRIVVIDPRTGELLAMADHIREDVDAVPFPWIPIGSQQEAEVDPDHSTWPRYRVVLPDEARSVDPSLARNRCVEDIYEPGSTFKPFIWALARSLGKLPDSEKIRFDPKNYRTPYGRRLADVSSRGELSWPEVLLYSSNIGMSKIAERLTHKQIQSIVARLGFGRRTELGLPGEATGLVTPPHQWTDYTQTSVAIGYEIGVTPVQMVRAFSAFARNGQLAGTVPTLRLTAFDPDDPLAGLYERVYEPEVALEVRQTIVGVVDRMEKLRRLRFPDDIEATYRMFGKSGTAKIAVTPPPGFAMPKNARGYFERQYNSSFIAGAPLEQPRLVVLVIIDDPGPELVRIGRAYGSAVAGPVVRRVMERSLRYLGVVPDAITGEDVASR
ncbi:MAG: penicillin-binding protein 2 [Planctomycetota bacterium]|nr:MAG: penicillin-binding protein 2 [Planctomycetota bacterium]